MCPRDPSCCSPQQTRRATTTDVSTKSRFRYRNKSADLAPCDWPRTRTDSNIFYSRSDRFSAADSCGSRGTRSNCRSPYRWCCRRAIRCDIYHGRRRRFLPQIYKQSVIHYKTYYYNFRTPPDVVRSTEAKVNWPTIMRVRTQLKKRVLELEPKMYSLHDRKNGWNVQAEVLCKTLWTRLLII